MTPEEVKAKFDKMSEIIGQLRLELRSLEPHVPTEHTDIVWNASEALSDVQGDVKLLKLLMLSE